MKKTRYKRLTDLDDDVDTNRRHDFNSMCSALAGFLLLFAFVACMIFLTSVESIPSTYLLSTLVSKQNKTKQKKRPAFRDESQFLNCSALIKGDKNTIELYVNNGRMKLDKERLFDLPMDCASIRERVYGDMPPFRPLNRPIAFVRTVYNLYELQEALLSISFHPDNVFCYVMDSKSSDKLKSDMRTMGKCFDNVLVLEKEYSLNSGGHGQDPAHFDCLEQILPRRWHHAVIIQNFDLIIKSPQQLSDLSETLNYTSIMGFDFGFKYRYNSKADWTPRGLKLFKNETGVPSQILTKKLRVRKSLNEVIMSKVFVKSIFEKLNLKTIVKLFDDNDYYGVDEMLVQTLYENYLGLDGQMESNCIKNHDDSLSRMTHWDWSGPNGFDKDCHSKWKRHGICILGVEYLNELSKSQKVMANKVMSSFDFGTIICTREMMKTNQTSTTPDAKWLSSFPQFREMQMKANGTYNRDKFDC
uniref:Uncharacterized protein n=2 Tax=Caenorhabditis japonica TaxID=281687 RepID=A0A8R1E0V1_CAEJA